MESVPREILEYETQDEKCPFREWLESLRDIQARAIIRKRLNRVRLGNLGVNRSVGNGSGGMGDRAPAARPRDAGLRSAPALRRAAPTAPYRRGRATHLRYANHRPSGATR